MTIENYKKAEALMADIKYYSDKINGLLRIVDMTSGKTAYTRNLLMVSVGCGDGHIVTEYIDKNAVKTMANTQIDYYTDLINGCKAELKCL